MKYLCGICEKVVASNCNALCSNKCDKWAHIYLVALLDIVIESYKKTRYCGTEESA